MNFSYFFFFNWKLYVKKIRKFPTKIHQIIDNVSPQTEEKIQKMEQIIEEEKQSFQLG